MLIMNNSFGFLLCLIAFIVAIVIVSSEGFVRDKRHKDALLTEEEHTNFDNGDIIDLDETGFDLALSQENPSETSKHSEDTREASINVGNDWDEIKIEDTDYAGLEISEGGQITPIPYIFDTESDSEADIENVTSPSYINNDDDDDEDLASGSGSGEIVIEIEEGDAVSNIIIGGDKDDKDNVTVPEYVEDDFELSDMLEELEETFDEKDVLSNETILSDATELTSPPFCEELFNGTWASWSPWIRSGDRDVRFRSCPMKHGYTSRENTCVGDHFEVRSCARSVEKVCRMPGGDVTEEYHVTCSGVNIDNMESVDELRAPTDSEDDCEYTLYDLKYDMAIGDPVTTDQLQTKDPNMWCFADDKYIPFYTPTKRCQDNLKSFCKARKSCKYETKPRKTYKNKGDINKSCWTEFVLGGILPQNFPDHGGNYMICQKFDRDSSLGKVLGYKTSHFATIYDTHARLPVISMTTVRSLGDEKWPEVPFMIEKSLTEDEVNVMSWLFKDKKKGITKIDDITTDCTSASCKHGYKQATPDDYEYSGYRIAPLLTPDIIGKDIGGRLSVFTMTNTAPMEPTVYSGWKNALKAVRRFAIDECKIPVEFVDHEKHKHRKGHELPELYLMAGAATSLDHVEVLGNNVKVPEMIWLAACCAHGADVSSFGVYAYNRYEQKPSAISVENLQMLLQSNFYGNVDVIDINLYPAFEGVCSAPENDVSLTIKIP